MIFSFNIGSRKGYGKLKKKLLIAVSVLVVIAVIVSSMLFYSKLFISSWFGARVYQGSRITVYLHITVDGEPAKITASKNDSFKFLEESKNCMVIKARANEKNLFEYPVAVNNAILLTVSALHLNWWEITVSNLYIDIDTEKNTYTAYETYSYVSENPKYHIEKCEEESKTVNGIDSINIRIGPKG